jgi:ribosome biogenesis GTPase A
MTKTKKLIKENLKNVDVVVEVLDARAPLSSRNPLLGDLIGQKPRLLVLNKEDLADAGITREWIEYFKEQNLRAVSVSSTERKHIDKLVVQAKILNTGRHRNTGTRLMIAGIPNVGKSALINALCRRNRAATGNRPGLTRGIQMINGQGDLLIMDTPGILWHKFDDRDVGIRLAVLGTIKDEILPTEELGLYTAAFILDNYPVQTALRYNLGDSLLSAEELLMTVGEKRGCLGPGGIVDRKRASMILMRDLREGRFGGVSLEKP